MGQRSAAAVGPDVFRALLLTDIIHSSLKSRLFQNKRRNRGAFFKQDLEEIYGPADKQKAEMNWDSGEKTKTVPKRFYSSEFP